MKAISSFLIFIGSLTLSLEGLAVSRDKVKELVNSYTAQQAVWSVLLWEEEKTLPRPLPEPPPQQPPPPVHRPHPRHPGCQPDHPQACIEAICNRLSRLECNDRDELLEITRQCRNVKGECIDTICSRVSRLECDNKDELHGVADMCRGLFDVSCIEYVCSRLSRLDCDDLSELREIAYQCR